jgi:hypothetical protein
LRKLSIVNRRCAAPHKLLHAFKLSQNHQVANAVSLCLRKKKTSKVTAGEILGGDSLKNLIDHDDGFRVLKKVRTSPSFWEQKLKNILAMIRQLGIPTLFLTLSAAESKWPELLVMLKWILDKQRITEDQALSLPYEDKASLIRRDPVTCCRYFDYKLRQAFKHLFKSEAGVFGRNTLQDFVWRIEFQQRGLF